MKVNKMWIIIASVVCVVLVAGISVFGRELGILKPTKLIDSSQNNEESTYQVVQDTTFECEVFALAETEEEAKEIADLYGISFVDYREGVAVYKSEKPILTLQKLGEENGYPNLSINDTVRTYEAK